MRSPSRWLKPAHFLSTLIQIFGNRWFIGTAGGQATRATRQSAFDDTLTSDPAFSLAAQWAIAENGYT
jgi:hypothetical protein